jgi:succinate dehydrogenase/fumarate reductase flavoprotein subunit
VSARHPPAPSPLRGRGGEERSGWNRGYDVVVVGYGGAGAVAAIAAADAGARVLLIEKSERLGGTTILSSGFARVASDAAGAAGYLDRTSGGRIGRPLVEALAQGMTEVPAFLEELARPVGAVVRLRFGADQRPNEMADLYDWPGRESLGWSGIEEIPGFDGYPWVQGGPKGQLLVRVLEENVGQRQIDVLFSARAERLLRDSTSGRVSGVVVRLGSSPGDPSAGDGSTVDVEARGGVILATGGFEFSQAMLRDYLELPTVYPMGHAGNTGDGIVMASEVGAALWHMWHLHGSYGFKLPHLPVAIRSPLGGARDANRPLHWIIVDQRGRRFTNELPPAPQDTLSRPLAHLNPETGEHDRIPAWLIFDERGRTAGPLGRPVGAQPEHRYAWSRDNSAEIAAGWIVKGENLWELAELTDLPAETLMETLSRWNENVGAGDDRDFSRPPGSMVPIAKPPFYAVQVWPVVSNTQGGPVHDERQRVIDVRGEPIPGLYAVGELGSFFGHIYLLGGNITEGIVGGRIAGREAARAARTGGLVGTTD